MPIDRGDFTLDLYDVELTDVWKKGISLLRNDGCSFRRDTHSIFYFEDGGPRIEINSPTIEQFNQEFKQRMKVGEAFFFEMYSPLTKSYNLFFPKKHKLVISLPDDADTLAESEIVDVTEHIRYFGNLIHSWIEYGQVTFSLEIDRNI